MMAAIGPNPPEMGGHVCANGRGLIHVRFREGSAESRPPSAFTDGASDPNLISSHFDLRATFGCACELHNAAMPFAPGETHG